MARPPQPLQVFTLESLRARCTECGDCWELQTGAKSEHHRRHPQVRHDGKPYLARRLAYELANGPIRADLRAVPKCGNPYCINPAHQSLLTEKQKGKKAAKAGAFSSWARRKKIAEHMRRTEAKITLEQAMEIRTSEEQGKDLAKRYGLAETTISAIKRGERWRDYSNPFAALMGGRA